MSRPIIIGIWNYKDSVAKVTQFVYKWRNLTRELAEELWIAREMLSVSAETRERDTSGIFIPVDKTWTQYCEDIGSSRQVVNTWLIRWFNPQSHVIATKFTGNEERYDLSL